MDRRGVTAQLLQAIDQEHFRLLDNLPSGTLPLPFSETDTSL